MRLRSWLLLGLLGSLLCAAAAIFPFTVQAQQAASIEVGDTVLNLSGQTSPGAFISIYKDQSLISSLVADSNGRYIGSLPAQTPGINRLNITARDSKNRFGDTASLEVNLQQHFPTDIYVFLPTTIAIDAFSLSGGQPLTVRGETIPAGIVTLSIDGRVQASAKTGTDGSWAAAINVSGLSIGFHQLIARVSDGSGNQSFITGPRSFLITDFPSATPPSNPPPPAVPQLLIPADGQIIRVRNLIIAGTSDPGVQVEVWDNGRVVGSVWSSNTSKWQLPHSLSQGRHSLKARACRAGQCSQFSRIVSFTYAPQVSSDPSFIAELNSHRFSSLIPTDDGKVELLIRVRKGEPPFHISVGWGDGRTDTSVKMTHTIRLAHKYTKRGQYTGRLHIQNAFGSQEMFFAVSIMEQGKQPIVRSYVQAALLAILTLLAAGVYWLRRQPTRKPPARR